MLEKHIPKTIDHPLMFKLSISKKVLVIANDHELLTKALAGLSINKSASLVAILVGCEQEYKDILTITKVPKLLGAFTAFSLVLDHKTLHFDIVIDLCSLPLRQVRKLDGYFYKPSLATLNSIKNYLGEFEKPYYVEHNPSVCAYRDGAYQNDSCQLCLQSCEHEAISIVSHKIEINHVICQGEADCVRVCPTAAIQFKSLSYKELVFEVYQLVDDFINKYQKRPNLLLLDEASRFDTEVEGVDILVYLPSLQQIDLSIYLLAISFGAKSISVLNETDLIFNQAKDALAKLGVDELKLGLAENINTRQPYKPLSDFREGLYYAYDWFLKLFEYDLESFEIDQLGSIGGLRIDSSACSLCFSCAQACPQAALKAKTDSPVLLFKENLCIQCGLCYSICPENAITLESRVLVDKAIRDRYEVVAKDEVLACKSCQKPFASKKMILEIEKKLKNKSKNKSKDYDLSLVYLCADCRVEKMFN